MIPVLTPAQAAEWDRLTAADGVAPVALMEAAGRGIASIVTTRFSSSARRGTIVVAGPGNNGGDGWVIARALHAGSFPVWVAPVPGSHSDLNRLEADLARRDGVREIAIDGPWPEAGLLIDALLGTGAKGPLRDPIAGLVHRLAELTTFKVAVDGPTGLDLGDGVSHGPLKVDLTITFGGYRRGHLLARDEVGDLIAIDVGFRPPSASWPSLFGHREAARAVPVLAARSHKGTRGRVVIIGGDAGMVGAARIAARAAFGAGAGLVHVAAPAASVAVLATAEPDVQTATVEFDQPLGPSISELLARADALVIGPGLGRAPGRAELVARVVEASAAPIVLDADGLTAFGGRADRLASLGRGRLVLTPHAGEFRGLYPDLAADLAVDPWSRAQKAAEASGAVVLVKGVPTVVAVAGRAPITVAAGNPGLATGGSGDTLSGLIGALLSQGIEPLLAAGAAAQALGDGADLAARRSSARTVRPMDVIAALPDVWRAWDQRRRAPDLVAAPILHELPAPLRV